jgi:hypothetical protein
MSTALATLTPAEEAQLATFEERIHQGLASFIEVGEALSAIREHRLYRETHSTFEDYCREKWGMSRSNAFKIMSEAAAAQSVDNCPQINRGQARELARVEPEQRQAVVEKAIQATGGKLTAAAIKEAAKPEPQDEDDEDDGEAQVIEMTPAKPAKISTAEMSEARDLWLIAKGRLDNIRRNDPERVSVLREVIAYAEQRIERSK